MMDATGGRIDHSISIAKANLGMLLIAVPSVAVLVAIYLTIWGLGDFVTGLGQFLRWRVVIPTLVVGIPLHELIHGVAWAMASGRPLSDVSFGFQWKTLSPYAHLREPVPAMAYRWGAVMPAVVLGLAPYLVGLVLGSGWLVCLGLFFIFAAGGDLLVLWLLRGVDGGALTEDHPSRAGCYVYPRGDRTADGQGPSPAT